MSSSLLSKKQKISKNIKKLDKLQYYEIYRLLNEYSHPYTINKNGVFFNLLDMKTELFNLIEQYVNYSIQKNELLKKDEAKKIKLKKKLIT